MAGARATVFVAAVSAGLVLWLLQMQDPATTWVASAGFLLLAFVWAWPALLEWARRRAWRRTLEVTDMPPTTVDPFERARMAYDDPYYVLLGSLQWVAAATGVVGLGGGAVLALRQGEASVAVFAVAALAAFVASFFLSGQLAVRALWQPGHLWRKARSSMRHSRRQLIASTSEITERSSLARPPLTDQEISYLYGVWERDQRLACPQCGGDLVGGPEGGASQNFGCYGCRSAFNLAVVPMAGYIDGERISGEYFFGEGTPGGSVEAQPRHQPSTPASPAAGVVAGPAPRRCDGPG